MQGEGGRVCAVLPASLSGKAAGTAAGRLHNPWLQKLSTFRWLPKMRSPPDPAARPWRGTRPPAAAPPPAPPPQTRACCPLLRCARGGTAARCGLRRSAWLAGGWEGARELVRVHERASRRAVEALVSSQKRLVWCSGRELAHRAGCEPDEGRVSGRISAPYLPWTSSWRTALQVCS